MLTPVKAIRANCIECCCGSAFEVRNCPTSKCPLFPYRLGHRPKGAESAPNSDEHNDMSNNTPETINGANSAATTAGNSAESTW